MEYRQMKNKKFCEDQKQRKYDEHVKEINALVDEFNYKGRFIPYVAPHYGGNKSKVLFIFQDPGPKTIPAKGGSGFLCAENDDPSAERFSRCLAEAGLEVSSDVMMWNAYPWAHVDGTRPNTTQLREGIEPMRRLLKLLPELGIIINMGRVAQEAWNWFATAHPGTAVGYRILPSFHTSDRGILNGGQQTAAEGEKQVIAVMEIALQTFKPHHIHRCLRKYF